MRLYKQVVMDRQYLQSFTVEQLEHYLKTLKRRVTGRIMVMQLTLQLGKENEELGSAYQGLVQKKQAVHHANQQKKNGFVKWVDRGKAQFNKVFSSGKKSKHNDQIESKHQNQQNYVLPHTGFSEKGGQKEITQYQKPIQSPEKKSLITTFNFDDIYVLGKQKLTNLFKKGKQGYNPNVKGEYEIQHQVQNNQLTKQSNFDEEGVLHHQMQRENLGNIAKLQDNHSSYQKAEGNQSAPQSRIAQFIKRTQKQQIKLVLPEQQPEKGHIIVVNTQIEANHESIKVHDGEVILNEEDKNQSQEKAVENVDNIKNEQQDHQFDVQYEDKMDNYELKEENVCEIVEKQIPESVQDIQEVVDRQAEGEAMVQSK